MMELHEAIKIIRSLATGENPDTGQSFGADSVLESPKVIRALHRVIQELESKERALQKREKREKQRREREERRRDGSLPEDAGRPWDTQADDHLLKLWNAGETVDVIGEQLYRTGGAIAARLVRLGKVPSREAARQRA